MTKEMAKKYIRQQIDLEVVERATAGPGEHAIGKGSGARVLPILRRLPTQKGFS